MRRFIITNPNLSAGRPGDVVTADELNMSDDKLDEWVKAGLGMEIQQQKSPRRQRPADDGPADDGPADEGPADEEPAADDGTE